MTDVPEFARRAALAERLLAAQRGLAAAELPAEAQLRLQRRLAAVCDALKAPAADSAAVGGRLDALLAALERECAEKSAHRMAKDNSPP